MLKKYLITGCSGFIGTNLMDTLIGKGADAVNLDIAAPLKKNQNNYWHKIDILEKDKLYKIFSTYKPTHVIHLAARTDTGPARVIDDYRVNIEGTSNVLNAIKATGSVQKVIITSSQFVHQHKGLPKSDEDYAPHTVYGESKALTEKLTREAKLNCVWTIMRPTNIWGPWHPRYAKEFWYVLKKGRYFHPGRKRVIRSYGFIGNVMDQIFKIFEAPSELVNTKVFYVGDEPINLYEWVNGFSLALTGKNVKVVPRLFVKALALTGDLLSLVNIKFPITSSRYHSMTMDNPAPMGKTIKTLGPSPYSLQEGISETVRWLIEQNSQFWTPPES